MLTWRFTLASVLLVVWRIRRGLTQLERRTLMMLFGLGAIGYTAQSWLFFSAVGRIGAGLSSVLLYVYPTFVTALSALFLGERLTKWRIMATILSLVGCGLVCWQKDAALDSLGVLMGLSAALVYAIYLTVSARVTSNVHPIDSIVKSASTPTIP